VCIGQIKDFLDENTEFVTCINNDNILIFNAFIASIPGSIILKECIDRMVYIIENNLINKTNFACKTLANVINKFFKRDEQENFIGFHGRHDKVHLLTYSYQYNITDNEGNVLFQNRNENYELAEIYMKELTLNNINAWFYDKNILKDDPLTVYKWDDKIRLGNNYDGGYVIADGVDPYDLYVSIGVAEEESFSRDFINKYKMNETNSFAFDGTIITYPWEYTTNISFIRKNISNINDKHNTNLDNLLSKHTNAFLKMDIEGCEWSWIMYTPYLKNIKQMVIEFHGVWTDGWKNHTLTFIHECFEKLSETHYLIHVHGNTGGGVTNKLPNVIEMTYIRREGSLEKNTHTFPVKGLDYPNSTNDIDIFLNAQPF
jgi:hypothetical protein